MGVFFELVFPNANFLSIRLGFFWVSQNLRRWMRMTTIHITAMDDDEIIDRPLTLVIGFARANKRWLINEREANTCADSFRACKKMHQPVRIHIGLPFVRHRDLGAKFATRRRHEIREKSPIGGRPKLTVLSDASLQIFLRSRVLLAARYRYASSTDPRI